MPVGMAIKRSSRYSITAEVRKNREKKLAYHDTGMNFIVLHSSLGLSSSSLVIIISASVTELNGAASFLK